MLQIILTLAIFVILVIPMGKYMYHIATKQKTFADKVFNPIDRCIYKVCGIKGEDMGWKKYALTLLLVNAVMVFVGYAILRLQSILFLNPNGISNMEPTLSFNTIISFMTNTNLQHYSGESGLSYVAQMCVIIFMMFTSAATGYAACMAFCRGLAGKKIGNFYEDMVRITTRILIPASFIVGLLLVSQGTPQTLQGNFTIETLEGNFQDIAVGPVAALESIKHLGTNGGGFFGANSTTPFENPTVISNIIEMISMMLLPGACVVTFGHMLHDKRKEKKAEKVAMNAQVLPGTAQKKVIFGRQGAVVFGAMAIIFLIGLTICYQSEMAGNPVIQEMGIDQSQGSMEGKEVRIGSASGALWSVTTTVTSNGSVNSMHDSTMPLSGLVEMLNMQINTWFGGVGVGWMNYYTFIIIAVFISGLMVGRTPEFLGKKVEAREMKIATIVALLHPFVILVFTAISSYIYVYHPDFVESEGGWLNNLGFHGLSEQLYEYTSCAANNGSGFEGLGDNTYFWNWTCGIVLILSRFLPIIGQVAIAGLLAQKKFIPESAGTLKTDTLTFGIMTFVVIFIVAALSFFPVHALSTIAEHLSL